MRKIATLIAAVALAFGAQAYTYQFALTISGITTGGSSAAPDTMSLIDGEGKTLAYITRSDVGGSGLPGIYTLITKDNDGNPITYVRGETETVHAHTLTAGEIKVINNGDGTMSQTYSMTFSSSQPISYSQAYFDGHFTSARADLVAVLSNEAGTYSGREISYIKLQFDGDTLAGASNIQLNAVDKIPPNPSIPEPTSGLLMLIGLAGLALRRRSA